MNELLFFNDDTAIVVKKIPITASPKYVPTPTQA